MTGCDEFGEKLKIKETQSSASVREKHLQLSPLDLILVFPHQHTIQWMGNKLKRKNYIIL